MDYKERPKATVRLRVDLVPTALAVLALTVRVESFGFPTLQYPRVQVPNNHILSEIQTYVTTFPKPST